MNKRSEIQRRKRKDFDLKADVNELYWLQKQENDIYLKKKTGTQDQSI